MERPAFIKKFDFRGVYETDITDQDAYYLGMALAKTIPLKKVLLGWDTRASSKNLAMHFIAGLEDSMDSGQARMTDIVAISYVDVCPIDYITAGAYTLDFDLSIMFTGSHNPWNWTGLLMHTRGGLSIGGETVEEIIRNFQFSISNFQVPGDIEKVDLSRYTNVEKDIEELYIKRIQELIPLEKIKPMNVLVDIGDGSGYKALDVLEKLLPQVTFDRINDRRIYDSASSHTADPSEVKNMGEIITRITPLRQGFEGQAGTTGEYDVGFGLDSDADRVLAVDEKGNYINGSLLGSAIFQSFQELRLASEIVGYAVDCGPSLFNTVMKQDSGRTPFARMTDKEAKAIPVAVGRSIVRGMVMDKTLDIGVENVGHFYLKEFFCTDSGVFSLVVILYWMSQHGALSTLATLHPDGKREQVFQKVSPRQTRLRQVPQEEQLEKLEKELERFGKMKKITVDGVRYEMFKNEKMQSFLAMRKSGYEAIEKYYFGSLNEKSFGALEEIVKKSTK